MFAPGFAPYAAPENIVNSKLVLAMVERGWEVEVVSKLDEDPYYGDQWCEPWLSLRSLTHQIDYPHRNRWGQIIGRFKDTIATGFPIQGVRWASRAFSHALSLHQKKNFQVVVSRSTPDIAHLAAMLFARKTGLPWVANWNDPVKMPPPYGQGLNENLGFVYTIFLNKVARLADVHTFPSERLKDYISAYLPIEESRSYVIPHIAGAFIPRADKNCKNSLTITHAGNLDSKRNPDSFLEGFAIFLEKAGARAQVKFVNIGRDNNELRDRASRFGVADCLEITGTLSYSETMERLRQSDLLLIIEAPCLEGIFLPSKFVDYVQTGRPILSVSPPKGTLHDILSTRGGGICVSSSAVKVAEAFETLYSSWQCDALDKEYGSARLYRDYAPDTILGQFEKVFARLGLAT